MTYASEQLYFTWGGRLGDVNSQEVWQCGIRFAPIVGGGVVGTPNQDQADALLAAATAMHTSPGGVASQLAVLTFAKLAHLDANGDYVSDAIIAEQAGAAGTVAVSGNGTPSQVSVAITEWSGQTLGKANYGRYYLPWSAVAVDTSGMLSSTIRDTILEYQGVFHSEIFDAVEDNKTSGGILAPTNMSFVGSGVNKRITKLRCGSVKDTQRRRRNRLTETYTTITL